MATQKEPKAPVENQLGQSIHDELTKEQRPQEIEITQSSAPQVSPSEEDKVTRKTWAVVSVSQHISRPSSAELTPL